METAADIRAQMSADRHLQTEINHALLAVADTLPSGSDPRVVRILTRTLQESWDVHVSFQDELVFPILKGRYGSKVEAMLAQGQSEHDSLSRQNTAVGEQLDAMLRGSSPDCVILESLLRAAHAQRQSHLELDAALEGWLPETLTQAERSLCTRWSRARPKMRFPLNLLQSTGSLFPRPGGRVH